MLAATKEKNHLVFPALVQAMISSEWLRSGVIIDGCLELLTLDD
jgi:hypothetical protein